VSRFERSGLGAVEAVAGAGSGCDLGFVEELDEDGDVAVCAPPALRVVVLDPVW